jgi:hypothetical protein
LEKKSSNNYLISEILKTKIFFILTIGGKVMEKKNILKVLVIASIVVAFAILLPIKLFAHCDTMDGPVVKAAQKALESGDLSPVLIWVQKQDETEIKKAFEKTRAIRKLSPEAKEFADMYFFETLVRIHRAGEGAPYTGIKPAGTDLGLAIPAADSAIASGDIKQVNKLINDAITQELNRRFKEVVEKKNFKKDDIEAGRQYVRAYIEFVHYVESVYNAAKGITETEETAPAVKEHLH